jgi:hypothetical protein
MLGCGVVVERRFLASCVCKVVRRLWAENVSTWCKEIGGFCKSDCTHLILVYRVILTVVTIVAGNKLVPKRLCIPENRHQIHLADWRYASIYAHMHVLWTHHNLLGCSPQQVVRYQHAWEARNDACDQRWRCRAFQVLVERIKYTRHCQWTLIYRSEMVLPWSWQAQVAWVVDHI